MSIKFFQVTFLALAGASLTALAFAITPLRAQTRWDWMPMQGHMNPSAQWHGQHRGSPSFSGMPCGNGTAVDPATLETLKGTALEINQYNGHQGVFVLLQTEQDTVEIHLGPAWYLDDQGIEVTPGSPLKVTGFRNQFNNRSMIMASEIQYGDQVVQLRDANGYPVSMGQGFRAHSMSW